MHFKLYSFRERLFIYQEFYLCFKDSEKLFFFFKALNAPLKEKEHLIKYFSSSNIDELEEPQSHAV